ncbi:uncharacterized protein UTRI_06035 [Ustilago trichophora]|uniref:Saccharopine dehydrogenase NADP binding domain-containing protein n=1 Tax=Ustilago trichophora TaxID=86804 RepID=A0A5C3EHK0_9BASI|nr:uncharacterized protein UTRI_06035 [Ustilago trichophora]
MSNRYDLVIFGATGFTGKLVCKYLLDHPEAPSWAIAGRSEARLHETQTELSLPSSVAHIVADTSDRSSLVRMAASARVVLNLVGPYRPFNAIDVVSACMQAGSHYVDLSGETGSNADIIDSFHRKALEKKLIVASSVGFDSLPFDLTTFLAVQKVKQLQVDPNVQVDLAECAFYLPYDPASGLPISAGTLASAISLSSEKQQLSTARGDWLSPISIPDPLTFKAVHWFPQCQKWGAHAPFSIHNIRLVNRTWGLLQQTRSPQAYGSSFSYKEGWIVPNKFIGILIAYIGSFTVWLLMNVQIARAMAKRIIPANSGPNERGLTHSQLRVETLATGKDGTRAICTMTANGNPFYTLTARMIVEAALTIAEIHHAPGGESTASEPEFRGGVLTPALIGAQRLAERLVKFGRFDIKVERFPSKGSVTKG